MTAKGDTVRCKILAKTDQQIFISVLQPDGTKISSYVSKDTIRTITPGYFVTESSPEKVTPLLTAPLSDNAKSGWYKIGDGEQVALTPGKPVTFTLGADMMEGESKTVTWSATNAEDKAKTGTATFNKKAEVVIPAPTGIFAYFLAPSDWSLVDCWAWNNTDNFTGGNWPGVACTKTDIKKNGLDVWMWKYDGDLAGVPTQIIFNNGGGTQTKDLKFENGAVYNLAGKTNESVSTGINQVGSKKAPAKLKIYSINGVKVAEVGSMADAEYILAPGVYVCSGKKYVIK